MKTEKIIHKNIVSYYSDDNNNLDGIYSIGYPADMDINYEIERAHEELEEKEMATNVLACALDYLIKQGKNISYETLSFDFYNCDYGRFKED